MQMEYDELLIHWNGVQVALLDAACRITRNARLVSRAMHGAGVGMCIALCNLFPFWSSSELALVGCSVSSVAAMVSTTAFVRLKRQRRRQHRLLRDLETTEHRLQELEGKRT